MLIDWYQLVFSFRMAIIEDWAVPIFDLAKDSVCFVVISPRQKRINDIRRLASAVKNVDEDKIPARCDKITHSTGFIVDSKDNRLFILTTANSIDHLYKASLELAEWHVNSLFNIQVLCDHYESDYRAAGLAELDCDTREYVRGTIFAVSCELNLLLIAVEQENIKRRSSEEMCPGIHRAIQISRALPHAGEDSMLLSWPPHKHRTVVTGCVGERRNVGEVTKPNTIKYNMQILEANITAESGSSGAPLLNKSGQAIGVLHGGFRRTHSYYIQSDLILRFLGSLDMTSGNVDFCFFFHIDTEFSQELLLFHPTDHRRKVKLETKGKGIGPLEEGTRKRLTKDGEGGGSGNQHKRRSLQSH
jgi:hypothetical protein